MRCRGCHADEITIAQCRDTLSLFGRLQIDGLEFGAVCGRVENLAVVPHGTAGSERGRRQEHRESETNQCLHCSFFHNEFSTPPSTRTSKALHRSRICTGPDAPSCNSYSGKRPSPGQAHRVLRFRGSRRWQSSASLRSFVKSFRHRAPSCRQPDESDSTPIARREDTVPRGNHGVVVGPVVSRELTDLRTKPTLRINHRRSPLPGPRGKLDVSRSTGRT